MKTTQALLLAGLAVLSLGAGAANAQSLTPSVAGGAAYATRNPATASTTGIAQPALPQSGSADENQPMSWLFSGWVGDHSPYRFQYGDLGGGGNG
jgi:hypothetical protein